MNIKKLQENWESFGKSDPMWAILTNDKKKDNQWEEERFFKTGIRSVKRKLDQLQQHNIMLDDTHALDFGCGIGRLTQALAPHFQAVSGVDIAPTMIDLANEKNRFPEKCRYFVNDKPDLKLFESNTFSFILSFIVLQHMQPKYAKSYIREFARLTRQGGIILFQIPSKPPQKYLDHLKRKKRKNSLWNRWFGKKRKRNKKRNKPIMEMYWIERTEVERFTTKLGLKTEFIERNKQAGDEWESYTYCLRKPQ